MTFDREAGEAWAAENRKQKDEADKAANIAIYPAIGLACGLIGGAIGYQNGINHVQAVPSDYHLKPDTTVTAESPQSVHENKIQKALKDGKALSYADAVEHSSTNQMQR